MQKLSGIGSKSRHRLKTVLEAGNNILNPKKVSTALSLPQMESARLLYRWHHAGWLKKIKRGVYLPVQLDSSPAETAVENSWVIAEELFSPGYIGGFSAVKHWDFSEQIFESVVYLTIKKTAKRNYVFSGVKFKLKTIKPYKIFGTKTVWKNSVKIKVSDPSKTMVDLLDDPVLGGGMRVTKDFFMEYWNSKHKNIKLLLRYAKKMKNKTIFKRLGFLLESTGLGSPKLIQSLRKQISSGYSEFDPSVKGRCILRKWNLKILHTWKKEYDRKKRSS